MARLVVRNRQVNHLVSLPSLSPFGVLEPEVLEMMLFNSSVLFLGKSTEP